MISNPGGSPFTQGARVYHSVNQNVNTATPTTVIFDSEMYDTDNIHDNITNNSRLTCRTAGKYLICACIHWSTKGGTGLGDYYTVVYIDLNGGPPSVVRTHKPAGADFHADVSLATIYDLAVGDYLEMVVFQNSGDTLQAESYNEASLMFMMQRIG